MRPEPITITLAGEQYKIRPLLLSQHMAIEKVIRYHDKADPHGDNAKVLQIALSRDYAEMAKDGGEIELESLDELRNAVNAILLFGGYLKANLAETAAPGEAAEQEPAPG